MTELRSQVLELETALKALPEPESKYREIIDSVGEAVFVIQDGFITFSNQACSELTGYSHEETSTFNAIILLVHPDDQEMVAQNHARRLQGDTRHLRYDFRIICKHGTVKWVELNSSLIMWEGKPAALCLATDITERKQTEEYLKESQDLIKVCVDSLPVGLLYVDSLEKIVFANQTFGSWWGMPGANLSGHTVEDVLGDHYAVIQNRLKTALAGQEMFYEEQVKYKDGVTREIVGFYAPHIVANGQVKGICPV